jgi:hypothetical protein
MINISSGNGPLQLWHLYKQNCLIAALEIGENFFFGVRAPFPKRRAGYTVTVGHRNIVSGLPDHAFIGPAILTGTEIASMSTRSVFQGICAYDFSTGTGRPFVLRTQSTWIRVMIAHEAQTPSVTRPIGQQYVRILSDGMTVEVIQSPFNGFANVALLNVHLIAQERLQALIASGKVQPW